MSAATRLDKLIANLGYGSRRDVRAMAARGRITLDGRPVTDGSARVDLDAAICLIIDGAAIDPLPGVVLVMNKPVGLTCSHKESGPLVYDLFPDRWTRRDPRLSTIGRLDKDTSGLLLLTDDGALLHKATAPKSHVEKVYRASLARPLEGHEAAMFASGSMMLDRETVPLLPARLEVLSPTEATITIREGRYHQVRRMFAAVGNHVDRLHRERLGGLFLPGDLAAGDYRILDPASVATIFG